ncbi:uncharacterized protein LOC119107448 [Pollicipes pollicipes]|uniref:uncharacterized protein LOC119107448 n=1 Tax=Pollicipes pollicipes TaxID=41117 RepID=UPI0018854DDB|nr:uncharacterized protein LOC119107448 [Pollicipes pollicipes]
MVRPVSLLCITRARTQRLKAMCKKVRKVTPKNIVVVFFTLCGAWFYFRSDSPLRLPKITAWLVNSSSCAIPDYDPWDESIAQIILNEKRFGGCRQQSPIEIRQDGNVLLFLKNKTAKNQQCEPECCFRSVLRADEGHSDDKYQFGTKHTCLKWDQPFSVKDEFIHVRCFCPHNNATVHEDFRAFVTPKNFAQSPVSSSAKASKNRNEISNIYLIGIDSVSRLNFKRFLPKIERLLSDQFNGISMLGLNKIGLNTFPNMLALLTGLRIDQVRLSLGTEPIDDLPFIWKEFSKLGYTTMFNEDLPEIATFNYKKQGFHNTPTDYYLRPLYRAIEDSSYVKSRQTLCIKKRPQIDFQLQWLQDFMTQVNTRQFALLFSSAMSHEGPLTYVSELEDHLHKFLIWYKDTERYNSSIVLFFSDHGMRFGPVMRTELGGYESRMPFFYVLLPPWYAMRYPQRVRHLRANARRLTTFFDAHATLRHLLAGAAAAAVQHINMVKLEAVRSQCAQLSLLSVTGAFHRLSQPQGVVKDTAYQVQAFEENVVQFVTTPGLGEFEATVRSRGGSAPLEELLSVVDVSRLNVYRGQSDCLKQRFDEMRFCYCQNMVQ